MEEIPKSQILEFRPDTLVEVRKSIGLDDPRRLNEAIDILEDWVRKQAHFNKKDFSRTYLERVLVTSKGLVERAKQKIDKLSTYKTLLPEFFMIADIKKDLAPMKNKAIAAVLPKLTNHYCRVFMCRVTSDFDGDDVMLYYKYSVMLCEYMMQNECCSGFIIIVDFRNLNTMNLITKFNPVLLSRAISLILDGYGLRLKALLILSESKAIETLVSFFKQFVKAKLANRLHAINSNESMYELVPPEILPVEYGGEERSLTILQDEWLEVLSSPENMASYLEMSKAATDESCRQKDAFHEQYLGMPGSFRTLSVD